jgi:hypothetical protein
MASEHVPTYLRSDTDRSGLEDDTAKPAPTHSALSLQTDNTNTATKRGGYPLLNEQLNGGRLSVNFPVHHLA